MPVPDIGKSYPGHLSYPLDLVINTCSGYSTAPGHIGTVVKKANIGSLIGPDNVLIRINATGLCYSDVNFMANAKGGPKMSELGIRCAGHEGAGVIVRVRSHVRDLKVGMRAGFKLIQDICQNCEHCRAGKDQYCLEATFSGAHMDSTSYRKGVYRAYPFLFFFFFFP